MNKYEAIGLFEVKYFTTALEVLDTMCKASEVTFLGSEKELGGKLVTVIVGGSISNIKEAIESVKLILKGKENLLKEAIVITRPHEEIMKFILKREDKEDKNKSTEVGQATEVDVQKEKENQDKKIKRDKKVLKGKKSDKSKSDNKIKGKHLKEDE